MNIRRLINYILLHIQHLPIKSLGLRPLCVKWGGVRIMDPKHTFIGENVYFDTLYPEKILVERGVVITVGTIIFYIQVAHPDHREILVHIKENAFIGAGTIICKPVTIGKNAIVGAGSVVTKDIPDNEIWAGNPARFIRTRHKA